MPEVFTEQNEIVVEKKSEESKITVNPIRATRKMSWFPKGNLELTKVARKSLTK